MAAYRGFYTDGMTARRAEVEVRIDAVGIAVIFAEGTVETWPATDLGLAEEVYPGRPARLKSARHAGATLTVEAPGFIEVLLGAHPGLALSAVPGRRRWRTLGLGLLSAVAVAAGAYAGLPWLATAGALLVPAGWEDALGRRAVERLAGTDDGGGDRFCAEARGRRVLERLVARLAAATETPHAFHVRVARRSLVNAFAAPGGHIVLFAGLIETAESADEVAGVLAHEMAHVALRHPTEGMVRAFGLSILIEALAGEGTGTALIGSAAQVLIAMSYSRRAEADADAESLAMLRRAGMPSQGIVRFLERLSGSEGSGRGLPPFLSTHPPPAARARAARAATNHAGRTLSEEEWAGLRGICSEG